MRREGLEPRGSLLTCAEPDQPDDSAMGLLAENGQGAEILIECEHDATLVSCSPQQLRIPRITVQLSGVEHIVACQTPLDHRSPGHARVREELHAALVPGGGSPATARRA